MSDTIFPRSPRETMAGWVYLPRFVDKVRLHLAGKLHPDYQPNFTKGFDEVWLTHAKVDASEFIEVVKGTMTDGEVCDWVRAHANNTPEAREEVRRLIIDRGINDDYSEKLITRKKESGLEHRDDIVRFVDYIDADEKRI